MAAAEASLIVNLLVTGVELILAMNREQYMELFQQVALLVGM